MSTRFRRGLLCLFVAFIAAALFKFVLWDGLEERHQAENAYKARIAAEATSANSRITAFQKKIARAVTLRDWEALAKEIESPGLEKEQQNLFSPIIAAKAFEARALERDNLLYFTGKLIKSDENDPTAKEYFQRARSLHEENIRVIGLIPERSNNCAWNARLWYRQGMEYYRSLIFLGKGESSQEIDLIDQSIQSFEKVFSCFPKDRDAETAIELLYKRAKEIKENPVLEGTESLKEKIPLFPTEEVVPGIGKSQQRVEGRH